MAAPALATPPNPFAGRVSPLAPAGPVTGGLAKPPAAKAPAKAPVFDASAMQSFLNGHGYAIPVDGINGPLTQAAAADFRGSRNAAAFNTGHGLTSAPTPAANPTSAPASAATAAPKVRAAVKASPKITSRTDQGGDFRNTTTSAAAGGTAGTQPSDTAAVSKSIQTILAPVIAEIKQAEAQRAAQGQSAIGGYTNNAANQTAGIDFGAPYTGAEAGQNAINTALLSQLTGAGNGEQDSLAATLNAAGIDPAGTVAAKIGTDTTGAAGAGLAKGDATLSSMLASGAAAGTYGKSLPAITRLGGLQDTAKLQGQVSTDEGKQLASLEAKTPQLVQSELSSLGTQRTAQNKTLVASILAGGVDPKTGYLTPVASQALSNATGLPPGTFTGVSAKTAATLADAKATDAAKAAALAEKTTHDRATEATASKRADISALSQADNASYHSALVRIKTAQAAGKAPTAHDIQTAFTTAVKIGYKFLGQKKTVKVGSVSSSTTGPEVAPAKALASMRSYWEGIMPSWTPAQVTAKALETLKAVPGYQVGNAG